MSNELPASIVKFEEVKDSIIEAIKRKSDKLNIKESVTLVQGFVSQPYSMELSNFILIGGPTIPMVMLLGNETGRIYFFAYKALVHGVAEQKHDQ